MSKVTTRQRMLDISSSLNLENTKVNLIISTYKSYCKDLLCKGNKVVFLNLVSLVPDHINSEIRYTLAYQCKEVAKLCGVGYYTAYSVINKYLTDLKNDLLDGKVAEMHGMFTIKPILRDNKVVKIHSFISSSISNELELFNSKCDMGVNSIRIHTLKNLKYLARR